MSYLSAIILGLVQGLAEFLPISSSGHLAVFQEFLNLTYSAEDNLLFEVLLHFGSLVAVFVAFWGDIKALVLEALTMVHIRKLPQGKKPDMVSRRLIWFIILATLPLVLVLPFKDKVEHLSGNTFFIGFAFLLTGCMLFFSDRMNRSNKDVKTATVWDVLIVGIAQALAVLPGISRSGTTITCGMTRGFDRQFAVKMSFLMSIPAVLGATLLEVIDALQVGVDPAIVPVYLVGMLVAGVSGYLAIVLLKYITAKGKFGAFSYYCWGIGLLTLILSLIK